MMGLQSKEPELWAEPRQLFARIPADNPLRRLAEVLRLEFVYQEVGASYGKRGNVSVDPAVILKMMLLLFFGRREERARADAHHPAAAGLSVVLGI